MPKIIASQNKMRKISSTNIIRHPAIPSPIQEELSEFYQVMPDPLEVENEILDEISELRQLQKSRSRWQNRSNSLPAVHGNFILLHRKPPFSPALESRSRFEKRPLKPKGHYTILAVWKL